MAVGVHGFERTEAGAVATLGRIHAPDRFLAVAGELPHGGGDLALQPALQRLSGRDRRPTLGGRDLDHVPVGDLETALLGSEIVGLQRLPGARIAGGRRGAPDMAR